jgi:CO/xanthine dehydrogenase Mo-binding subunit
MTEYVGKPMPRYQGLGEVTGTANYVDDFQYPGMLYVKALRSPVARGTVQSLDFSETLKVPGVVGVLTADDIPGANAYGAYGDQMVFNPKDLRYKGEPIAAVVALDEDAAQAGLLKAKLEVEELTPVFDMFEAMKPDAPIVRPGTPNNMFDYDDKGTTTRIIKLGDVEAGFKEADHILEGRYVQAIQDHASMEPQVSVAYIDDAGRLTIHTHSQCLNGHLGQLCGVFGLTHSQINYLGGRVGGGYGGKNEINCDHIAGLAALKFRKPVKYRLTRQEDLTTTGKRGAWVFDYKTGVTNDGRIVASHIIEYHDSGAYCGFSPYGSEKCGMFAAGPYNIPNILVEANTIFTNKFVSISMRGYSVLNGQVAADVQMSRMAEQLGMDPWELRFINAWRDGDLGASRYVVQGAGALEAMKRCAEMAGIELPDRLLQMSSRSR